MGGLASLDGLCRLWRVLGIILTITAVLVAFSSMEPGCARKYFQHIASDKHAQILLSPTRSAAAILPDFDPFVEPEV